MTWTLHGPGHKSNACYPYMHTRHAASSLVEAGMAACCQVTHKHKHTHLERGHILGQRAAVQSEVSHSGGHDGPARELRAVAAERAAREHHLGVHAVREYGAAGGLDSLCVSDTDTQTQQIRSTDRDCSPSVHVPQL